jgi:putative FmdB family regulatory protein
MPAYDYTCQDCGTTFEVRLSFTEVDQARPVCPQCNGKNTRRLISRVHLVATKGGSGNGFRLTREHVEAAVGLSGLNSEATHHEHHHSGGCSGCSGGNCSACGH